jgi:hypothetical protein
MARYQRPPQADAADVVTYLISGSHLSPGSARGTGEGHLQAQG